MYISTDDIALTQCHLPEILGMTSGWMRNVHIETRNFTVSYYGRKLILGRLYHPWCLFLHCSGCWIVGIVLACLLYIKIVFIFMLRCFWFQVYLIKIMICKSFFWLNSAHIHVLFNLLSSRRSDQTKAMRRATFWREKTCTGYLWVLQRT